MTYNAIELFIQLVTMYNEIPRETNAVDKQQQNSL